MKNRVKLILGGGVEVDLPAYKNIENVDKVEIKPSQIDLGKEINKIGTYEAKINLHAEIQALIHIEVVKQEEKN